jgi:hypothetical protein
MILAGPFLSFFPFLLSFRLRIGLSDLIFGDTVMWRQQGIPPSPLLSAF